MAYTDNVPHAGSAEVLFTGMYDEPAGTIARTVPRGLVGIGTLSALTTTGQVAVRVVPLPAGLVVSNIAVHFGGTPASGPTHFWLALADIQLNVLAVTADQLAAAQPGNTFTKLPATIPYAIPYTGLYTVLASSSASTTAPTLAGATLTSGIQSPAPALCGTAGNQAAPPALGAQLNSGAFTPTVTANFAAWLS